MRETNTHHSIRLPHGGHSGDSLFLTNNAFECFDISSDSPEIVTRYLVNGVFADWDELTSELCGGEATTEYVARKVASFCSHVEVAAVDLENTADEKLHNVACGALHNGNISGAASPKKFSATGKVGCRTVECFLAPFELADNAVNRSRSIFLDG